ncbi:MAG: diaminopimelate epimerase [Chloroflexi bacterium]|nr:diaminopimelate epimerase [Chloroflexota bacterium]
MKFKKMHGAGNDYVYVDARTEDRDWPKLAIAVSDRHKGIGSDGLIVLLPSDKADVRMQMFNADGSEGEMCGNGIRCFVRFALGANALNLTDRPVRVETGAGVLSVTPMWTNGIMTRASVGMGPPRLVPSEIPLALRGQGPVIDHILEVAGRQIPITGVSMGNPHAVAFIEEDVDDYPLHEVGPKVEVHPLFPNKVNFEIVNILSRSRLKVRVWERGSGLTQACGTGACAVVVAARLKGVVDDNVTIDLPGGSLNVKWTGEGDVILEGPVAEVFEGEWLA